MNSFGQQYPLTFGGMQGSSYGQTVQPTGALGATAPLSAPSSIDPTRRMVSGQAASAADPFAGQRAQYQTQLSQLMGGLGGDQVTQDINSARSSAQSQNPYLPMLQKLMTDPSSVNLTPGSQFQMEQGNKALERSMAAQGFLGSGNILQELQKQSQGIASQDYGNQVNQMISAAGLYGQESGRGFEEQFKVAGLGEQARESQMGGLTTMSGANQGSPSAAGSFLMDQFAQQPRLSSSGSGSGGGVANSFIPNAEGQVNPITGTWTGIAPQSMQRPSTYDRNWGMSSLL